MDENLTIDLLLNGDAGAIAISWPGPDAEASTRIVKALAARAAQAMSGYQHEHKAEVDRLAAVLLNLSGSQGVEHRIQALSDCCFYYERIGYSHDGIQCGEAARALALAHGLPNLERRAQNSLGTVYMDLGNFEMACQCLERTLVLARGLDDPFLECVSLTNSAALLKQMGLYHDALFVADRALSFELDTPQGKYLQFLTAGNGLFCAHRLHDDAAALRYLTVGSALVGNTFMDPVSLAMFENYRALYLIARRDAETAELVVAATRARLKDVDNPRVLILLGIAEALCDWASGTPARIAGSRQRLRELYHVSKTSRLHHDEVLRALVQVSGAAGDRNEPDSALVYAKELVEYTTGVKRAKFFRQLSDQGVQIDPAALGLAGFNPLSSARTWLGPEASGDPGASAPRKGPRIEKHDELMRIHEDLAQLRTDALRKSIRTAAYGMAENWALAAEFFDDQTGQHCFRVGRLAGLLAKEIGMDEAFCVQIEHAARLHDIGKIGVNEMILMKPGPLDPSELTAMRAHSELGAFLLEGARDPTLQMAATIARHHHEWWNGTGYPAGLAGDAIPLAARICALADVYDALTNSRPYKAAWSHRVSVEQMASESAVHFDPALFGPFLKVLEIYVASGPQTSDRLLHLQDMDANGLLNSRRRLMEAARAGS